MDRAIAYLGEQASAYDICYSNLFQMISVAKLAQAVLGNGPWINNLSCIPTSPASLNVTLNPGEIYSIQNIDNTAYGILPDDTTHQILKGGIMLDPATIAITPPLTPGQSIDYLIQVIYQDVDSDQQNRPFFGSSPALVYTTRRGNLIYGLKAGIPATTGTQVPPSPDVGYTGAWVITCANGQTQIMSGDIAEYSASPFILENLNQKISEPTADARYVLQASMQNSIAANGYQYFPGGLLMQWLTATTPVTGGGNISTSSPSFPIAFPNNCFVCLATNNQMAGTTRGINVSVYNVTQTGFTFDLSCTPANPFGETTNIPVAFYAIGN